MEKMRDKKAVAISKKADITFSIALLPITVFFMGFAFYIFYIKPETFPLILLTGLLFGFSCMGLKRMSEYKKRGKDVAMVK